MWPPPGRSGPPGGALTRLLLLLLPLLRLLLLLLLSVTLATGASAATAANANNAPTVLSGELAAAALADAASNKVTAAALPPGVAGDLGAWKRELVRDPNLKFSPRANKLAYGCASVLEPPPGARVDAMKSWSNGTRRETSLIASDGAGFAFPHELDPLATNAFKLHSRPGASKKIVLDFTGHTLRAATAWGGFNKFGDVPIVTAPFDSDGLPGSFSLAELATVVSVWRQVADDYSAWDVDVTTEEPPGTDNQADARLVGIGTRVIIGPNSGWYGTVGGVALGGGFGQSWSGPAVFDFNWSPSGVAIAASHEVGHALDLRHHGTVAKPDGTGAGCCYGGHGAWAPVMGYGYGKHVIQWSKGDFTYANQPNQDDIAIISRTLGVPDWSGGGQDASSAQLLALAPASPANTDPTTIAFGLISRSTETHVYQFAAFKAGTVSLSLSVTAPGSQGTSRTHLAAKVRVLRADTGAVVGTPFANVGLAGIDGNIPATPSIPFALPSSGNYLIELSATNSGAFSTGGYSEYGTSGTYSISMSAPVGLVVVGAGSGSFAAPIDAPPLVCRGLTTLQLTSGAGNCNLGVLVRPEDVYDPTLVGTDAAVIEPPVGTVLVAGNVRNFTATMDGVTCTTTVTVLGCAVDKIMCSSPSYSLSASSGALGCDSVLVPASDLYQLYSGGAAGGLPLGTATTTLPADGRLGPGVHRINVVATSGGEGASCTSVVTVNPCRPSVIATMTTSTPIALDSSPGVCAATPLPSAVIASTTLGRGALSVTGRTSLSSTTVLSPPLTVGAYFLQVVYSGGLSSSLTSSAVNLAVKDVEAPVAAIKATIVRSPVDGSVCARGANTSSKTACVSVWAPLTTGAYILELSDNCGAAGLTRSYSCLGKGCPASASIRPTVTKLCVPVSRGGGRVDAVYTLVVTDKAGIPSARLDIPIAGYHYRDSPRGVTCYSA